MSPMIIDDCNNDSNNDNFVCQVTCLLTLHLLIGRSCCKAASNCTISPPSTLFSGSTQLSTCTDN